MFDTIPFLVQIDSFPALPFENPTPCIVHFCSFYGNFPINSR